VIHAHQPSDAVLATGLSGLPKVQEDARGAVDAVTRGERGTDQAKQPGILLGPVRERVREPLVVAARSYAEHVTHLTLMNSYVERTRPALSFVDIGIALRDCPDAGYCPLNPGNSTTPSPRLVC